LRTLPYIIICTLLVTVIHAQTGPGGVGTSVTNCFWIKADAGTSSTVNAAAISSWNDQSGNSNNLSQSAANQQPLYTTNLINGFPAIQFDNNNGTNDKMTGADSPTLDNTNGYTFFMIARPQVVDGAARVIVSKRTTVAVDQSFMQFFYTGNTFHTDIQTNNNRYATAATFAANNNYLIDQLYDGTLATGSRCKTYVAGNLNVTSGEASTSVPDNASPIVIGSTDATDPRPFGGYIAEVIIFRKACNDPERIIVDNYLSAKYNISLAVNDKYAGDNAGNGNYDFEVAGVGKDATGSNPSFSASTCGGLGISTTGIGFDNSDYILAGHATTTNSQVTTDIGGMTGTNNARWHRIWYVDITNTGTNIETNIEFDMSDGDVGPVAISTPSNYVLLYRAAQTGNWTELTTATSIVGDRILFSNYTFVNDGYYTIGTRNSLVSPLPIELIFFNAQLKNGKVDLSWATQTERNNKEFVIERSKNAIDFEVVNVIKGAGNSMVKLNYSSIDTKPFSGVSYYRLKQVDFSGDLSYSPIAVIVNNDDNKKVIIYPNPSNGNVAINLVGFKSIDAVVNVFDESGKVIIRKRMNQSLSNIMEDDLKLISGIYLVVVQINGEQYTSKLIVK
jgi:hypothetical protein